MSIRSFENQLGNELILNFVKLEIIVVIINFAHFVKLVRQYFEVHHQLDNELVKTVNLFAVSCKRH